MKQVNAVDLVNKPIVCPFCAGEAVLRKDDQGYWVECERDHRPVVNVLGETLLRVPTEEPKK